MTNSATIESQKMSSCSAKQLLTEEEYTRRQYIASMLAESNSPKPDKLMFHEFEEHVLQHFGVAEDIIFSQEAISEIVKYSDSGFDIRVVKFNRTKELVATKRIFLSDIYAANLEKWEEASLQRNRYENELASFNKVIAQRQAEQEQARIAQELPTDVATLQQMVRDLTSKK